MIRITAKIEGITRRIKNLARIIGLIIRRRNLIRIAIGLAEN